MLKSGYGKRLIHSRCSRPAVGNLRDHEVKKYGNAMIFKGLVYLSVVHEAAMIGR